LGRYGLADEGEELVLAGRGAQAEQALTITPYAVGALVGSGVSEVAARRWGAAALAVCAGALAAVATAVLHRGRAPVVAPRRWPLHASLRLRDSHWCRVATLTSTMVEVVACECVRRQPMQPPSRQPIGFWAARAGEAIRARTRGALREIGVTQPEWWVLHQLSLHPEGVGRAAVVETIGPNETPAAIESAIDSAIEKGWIQVEGPNLLPTEAGAEQFERSAEVQKVLQAERMEGITVEDFTTTISVLQKTIANVGGDAWHW
jgi:hypothetical protein